MIRMMPKADCAALPLIQSGKAVPVFLPSGFFGSQCSGPTGRSIQSRRYRSKGTSFSHLLYAPQKISAAAIETPKNAKSIST